MSNIDKDMNEEVQLTVGKTISKAEGYINRVVLTFDDGSSVEFYAWRDDDDAPVSSSNMSATMQGPNE